MSANILCVDFLSICLLCADCDIDKNMEEIVVAAELYQQEKNRHFGISDADFRNALSMLIFKNFSWGYTLAEHTLREMLPIMLRYHDVYFNDEGEHWDEFEPDAADQASLEVRNWYDHSKEEYLQKVLLKAQMKTFFNLPENSQPDKIQGFLEMHGVDRGLFQHCSRPGKSS